MMRCSLSRFPIQITHILSNGQRCPACEQKRAARKLRSRIKAIIKGREARVQVIHQRIQEWNNQQEPDIPIQERLKTH